MRVKANFNLSFRETASEDVWMWVSENEWGPSGQCWHILIVGLNNSPGRELQTWHNVFVHVCECGREILCMLQQL